MLHSEVQLPRDKPQKAGQEGPVKFGFEHASFGRTRNFVEVLSGREVQSEMSSLSSERASSTRRCVASYFLFV